MKKKLSKNKMDRILSFRRILKEFVDLCEGLSCNSVCDGYGRDGNRFKIEGYHSVSYNDGGFSVGWYSFKIYCLETEFYCSNDVYGDRNSF